MKISVIIPTYKPKDYLWECLNSLKQQNLDVSVFEVILILNGCGSPWREEILFWIDNNPELPIKFIHTYTPGVSNARNLGIKQACGDYITFIDDDDYISTSYLSDLLAKAKTNTETVVISNTVSFEDKTNNLNNSYSLRKLYYALREKSSISLFQSRSFFNGPCMKLIPSQLIRGYLFDISFRNNEDSLFMYQISCGIKQIAFAKDTAIYYRRIRKDSAYMRRKNLSYLIKNELKFACKVVKTFLLNPFKYNFPFTISRLLASVKNIYYQMFM